MNAIIEYIIYTFGILLVIAVPLALAAGGLASRSVVVAPNTGDDCTVADVTNQKPNVVFTNQTGERELTVTSQFDDVKKATAEKHLRVMPARSNLAVRFVPIGVIPIADLHRSNKEPCLCRHK